MLKHLLLISSATASTAAYALVYSSSLKFKLTDTRVNANSFDTVPKVKNLVAEIVEKNSVEAPLTKNTANVAQVPEQHAIDLSRLRGKIPARHPHESRIFVVDEEALMNGILKPIPGAQISMISPSLEKAPMMKTSGDGLAKLPYPFSESVRIFARAKGYMMGMGYATFGEVTYVPLVSERRFSVIARSLSLNIPAGQLTVMGRLVDNDFRGIPDSQIKFNTGSPHVVYSGPFFGGIPGYFADDFNKTDSLAAFIANGVSRSLQSIRVLNADQKIPNFTYDFSGIPESVRFVSLALQNGPSVTLDTEFLDGDSLERPSCGLVGKVMGHSRPAVPEEDGPAWIESKLRPMINDLAIDTSKCGDYLPTFVSQPSNSLLYPPIVGLFSNAQIQETLSILNRDWSSAEGLVLGHVYPQKEFKHAPVKEVSASVYASNGKRVNAEIYYFNQENQIDPRLAVTDAHHQNFAILGLEEGEYHFVYRNGANGSGLGIQVVRPKRGGITQVDF